MSARPASVTKIMVSDIGRSGGEVGYNRSAGSADKDFVLRKLRFQPRSAGGPPGALQIVSHHFEDNDIGAPGDITWENLSVGTSHPPCPQAAEGFRRDRSTQVDFIGLEAERGAGTSVRLKSRKAG